MSLTGLSLEIEMYIRVVFLLALKQETLRHLAKTIAKDHTKLSPEETRSIGLVLC
jgi:hypothetical protein